MTAPISPQHYVCTYDQARTLILSSHNFWVGNCGCREDHASCARSPRIDICLTFDEKDPGSGTEKRQTTLEEVQGILEAARFNHLVPRPFRDATRTKTTGICFCCDDCCWYFLNRDEICDPGTLIEQTDLGACTSCGDCLGVCYFNARSLAEAGMTVDRDECYGCGLCVEACPSGSIQMVGRV